MTRAMRRSRSDLTSIARQAMIDNGLLPDFSAAVLADTRAIAGPADATDSLRDLRSLPWASIDNDDSRDLDQLSVAEPTNDGRTKIFIAVADVDAIVKQGSAIDAHASTNTTSVYTAAETFPMLPPRLSTDLTSLGEGQDRLAIVVEMTVAADGTVSGSDLYRARVRNHAKLAYDGVAAWLDGTAPPRAIAAAAGMDAQLRIQDRVAQAMKALRHRHGALT
ncbi:MAG TPA: RNB domain-containing ribonuclease, partial [Candidatus Binatia bacterium]|nr:RNB domain-containing ribonuclease [Candidatus Binatia bacterium]